MGKSSFSFLHFSFSGYGAESDSHGSPTSSFDFSRHHKRGHLLCSLIRCKNANKNCAGVLIVFPALPSLTTEVVSLKELKLLMLSKTSSVEFAMASIGILAIASQP